MLIVSHRPGGDTGHVAVFDADLRQKVVYPKAVVVVSLARELPLCHDSLGQGAEVGHGGCGVIHAAELGYEGLVQACVAAVEKPFKKDFIIASRVNNNKIFFCLFFFLSYSLIYAYAAALVAAYVAAYAATDVATYIF